MQEGFLFLFQMTIEGGGYWYCFRQTSSPTPGTFLLAIFLIVVLLMLLNTLIAMMEDTYIKVNEESFPNYASSFGKVSHVHMRGWRSPPPKDSLRAHRRRVGSLWLDPTNLSHSLSPPHHSLRIPPSMPGAGQPALPHRAHRGALQPTLFALSFPQALPQFFVGLPPEAPARRRRGGNGGHVLCGRGRGGG